MNPNATITDEQFKAYLKKVRDMVEGPYTEWQKEIEVTNTFPEKFYQSNIDNDIYRYSLPVEYGGSPRRKSCRFRKSSPVVLRACVCTCTMHLT